MKIIHINASYKPAYIYGGPALSVSRLCEELVRVGVNLEVFTTTANGKNELDVISGVQQNVDGVKVSYFKRLTKDHTHFSPALLNMLNKTLTGAGLKRQKGSSGDNNKIPTIVHIHVWWNLVSVFSCFIARKNKTPVILTPRGTLSNYSFGNRNSIIKNYIHSFLGKSLLEYCHVHVTSEKEKEDILRIFKPRTITVIPNFIYLPALRKTEINRRDDCRKIKLLFLSRIEEKKGLDIFFSALADLEISYELTIAGSGEPKYIQYLKALADRLNITSFIKWIGQQNQEEKWAVMEQHDLMVLPSHDENFANVVIECLSTGTPVLISEQVGLADYVRRHDLGWICKVTKPSIIENLLSFAQQRDKTTRIQQEAPRLIRTDFDEQVLVQEFLKMYTNIANQQ